MALLGWLFLVGMIQHPTYQDGTVKVNRNPSLLSISLYNITCVLTPHMLAPCVPQKQRGTFSRRRLLGMFFFLGRRRQEGAGRGRKGGGWGDCLHVRVHAHVLVFFFQKNSAQNTSQEAAGYVCVCVCVCVWHDIFMRVT